MTTAAIRQASRCSICRRSTGRCATRSSRRSRASATASASSWGRRSTALERELARAARRRARDRGVVGHRRAAARADGARHRAGRRGRHDDLFVLRDRRRHRPASARRPVFVDIDPATFNIDPAPVARRDHAADQGDPAGASVRPERRPRSDSRRGRRAPASRSSRTRRRRSARPTRRGRSAASARSAASRSSRARTSARSATPAC